MTVRNAIHAERTQPRGAVTGPAVVLIHGFASTGADDWPAARWAVPLAAAGRETLVVRLPGHGSGGPVAAPGEATTTRVLEQLATTMGTEVVDVVGYSLGARLAWDLAAQGAVPVRQLVLGGLSAFDPFGAVDLAAARAFVAGGTTPSDPITAAVAALASAPGRDAASLLNLVEGMAREPFDPAAKQPAVPTLFVAGIDDPMAQGIDQIAALVNGARVVRVPGDHLGALAGDELRDAVFDFLGVSPD